MKRIVILGAGTAGTIMANRLRPALQYDDWKITLIDRHRTHYYQPGFLFIPFGLYGREDVVMPKRQFLPQGVELFDAGVREIDHANNLVLLDDGRAVNYDLLIIATGARTVPAETEGLAGPGWYRDIFDFYTIEGADRLRQFLDGWPGGRLVTCVAEMPIKCPVAPIEFLFLADSWFRKRGMRDRVELELITPLDGAFTKPICSQVLGHMFEDKGIRLTTEFALASVDNEQHVLADWEGRTIPYDCLVMIPVNMGDELIARSGLGDDLNFVPTEPQTLQARGHKNIYVIGDATDLPSSKAGSVAHFQADILTENILAHIAGRHAPARFDGHANCFIETGHGRAVMVDFNYDTEPLPGKYPWPVVGPFTLLAESKANHLGKMAFRWLYWNVLLRGKSLPVSTNMSMAGKYRPRINTQKAHD